MTKQKQKQKEAPGRSNHNGQGPKSFPLTTPDEVEAARNLQPVYQYRVLCDEVHLHPQGHDTLDKVREAIRVEANRIANTKKRQDIADAQSMMKAAAATARGRR